MHAAFFAVKNIAVFAARGRRQNMRIGHVAEDHGGTIDRNFEAD